MQPGLVKGVTFREFVEEMRNVPHPGQFSSKALRAIYDYLTNLADDTGEPIDWDPVAIRCDFEEYNSTAELAEDTGRTFHSEEQLRRFVEDHATVVAWDVKKGKGVIVLYGW